MPDCEGLVYSLYGYQYQSCTFFFYFYLFFLQLIPFSIQSNKHGHNCALTASPFSLETTLLSFISHLLPRIILSTSWEACYKTKIKRGQTSGQRETTKRHTDFTRAQSKCFENPMFWKVISFVQPKHVGKISYAVILRWWYSTQFFGVKKNVWVLNMQMHDSVPHMSFEEVLRLQCNHA